MSRVFGLWAIAALVLFAPGEAAMAQLKSDTPVRVVPATPRVAGNVRASSVGGLGFAIPATRASDDKLLIGIINYVADRVNHMCGRVEAFAWLGVGLHSGDGLKIHIAINQALQIEGYSYVERELPPPDDKDMAEVEAKITAYSAESTDRNAKDRHIIAVWYRETDDLNLMLCQATPKPAPNDKD